MRARREFPDSDIALEVEKRWRDNGYTVDATVVVARAETSVELRDALIRLPYTHRAAFVLRDAHGLTTPEMAKYLRSGYPPPNSG